MKIELKRIEISERLSDETNCFAADLYIDGIKIGQVMNRGDGEGTEYQPDRKEGWTALAAAQRYCITLPPQLTEFNGERFEFEMNLGSFLDNLVERHMAVKALKAFNQKIKTATGKTIVYGEPDAGFLVIRFQKSFDEITSFKIWKQELVNNIRSTVKTVEKNGKPVLMTNMPIDMCLEAGLKPYSGIKNKESNTPERKTKGNRI